MGPSEANRFCTGCGAPVSSDLPFCQNCGGDLSQQAATAPPVAGPQQGAPPPGHQGPPPAPPMAPPPPHTQPPWPVPVGPAIPKMRVLLGATLGIVGLILVLVALLSHSWFVIESDQSEYDTRMEYGLREIHLEYILLGETEEITETYDTWGEEAGKELDSGKVAGRTWSLLLTGAILAAIFVLLALVSLIGMFRGGMTWLPILLGVVAGILLLVAVVYFGIAYQSALEEDVNMKLDDLENSSHGMGSMFYLALAGGVLVMMGALMSKVPGTSAFSGAPPDAMRQG